MTAFLSIGLVAASLLALAVILLSIRSGLAHALLLTETGPGADHEMLPSPAPVLRRLARA